VIYSGDRENSYRKRDCPEHEFVYREIIENESLRPQLDASIKASIQSRMGRSDSAESSHKRQGLERLGYKLMRRVQKMLMKVGVHPNTPRMLFRYGGGGGYIRWLQKRTG